MATRLANGSKSHHANGCNTGGWTFQTVCFTLEAMVITKAHAPAIALSAGSVITAIVGAIKWFTGNVTVPSPNELCVNGLPSWSTGIVTTALPILVAIVAGFSLFTPSVSDRINEKAGFDAAKRLSTVPPAPTSTEIK